MSEPHAVLSRADAATDALAPTSALGMSERIRRLKEAMLAEPRYLSIEQAMLITEAYQEKRGNRGFSSVPGRWTGRCAGSRSGLSLKS